MAGRRLRRAGARWRILVHERAGVKGEPAARYGRAFDVSDDPAAPARGAEAARRLNAMRPDLPPLPEEYATAYTVLENTEFDELVIGRWLWLEQMDSGAWIIDVGGVTIDIKANRDGKPIRVVVHAPEKERPGCEYILDW